MLLKLAFFSREYTGEFLTRSRGTFAAVVSTTSFVVSAFLFCPPVMAQKQHGWHFDSLRANSSAVLQLSRLDLIIALLRCSDVPCPIDFRTIQVAPV